MLAATDLEIRVGARLLLEHASFSLSGGDKVGLVGRNGAGKTTLTAVLAGERLPTAGTVVRSGRIGYLPQDPRAGDPAISAEQRILGARGLDAISHNLRLAADQMSDPAQRDRSMDRYARLESEFVAAGGYRAQTEAIQIAANLGLPERVLGQPLGTLSGGQRRRVELARILFSDADLLLLDEPTNHLDADSVGWLRDFLSSYAGCAVVISHDPALLQSTVNRVLHLDATQARLDLYNMRWQQYLQQRESDERRRKRERTNAEKQATALREQADRMRAKATKARSAQNMLRRAERLTASLDPEASADKVAKIRFPVPAPCGRTPLTARELSKSYGSLEVFTDVDLAIDRGSRVVVLGLNGAGKTTLLRILAGKETPDTGVVTAGHGLRLGYYAQEHETLIPDRTVLENVLSVTDAVTERDARTLLGAFLFSGDAVYQPVATLSGGEKTRLALACLVLSGANVLLLDEPTNNLDPASRQEILRALARYEGAIVLVTHDEGAVAALRPERLILLPDGVEDHWSADYSELVALA